MKLAFSRRWIPPLIAVGFLFLALFLLRRELRAHHLTDILNGLWAIPLRQLAEGVLFTAGSFAALALAELIAVRYVGLDLTVRRVGLASFTGYSFSNALGFPVLTGAPVRYRLYTSWGVDAGDVARIIALYTTTFWLGFLALAGTALVLEGGAESHLLSLPPALVRPLGLVLLTVAAAYLAWCVFGKRPLRLGGWKLQVPSWQTGVRQLLVSAMDWTCAAATLYVLIPGGHGVRFAPFLAAFMLAQVIGLMSMVPAGLGVFEIVLLLAMPGRLPESTAVASILAFRAVYQLMPLVLAALLFGGYELRRRREVVGRALGVVGGGVSSAVPLVLSAAVFAAGALLVATGALPQAAHLSWLLRVLPLPLLEASHFLGSIVGALLLILAWGLARRLDGAYHATLVLLAAGAVLAAARGGGLVTALALLLVLVALAPARGEFIRRSSLTAEPVSPEWLMGVGAVLITTVWLGVFAYREVAFSGDLWWRFALRDDAPRFLRSSVAAASVLLLFAVRRLLRPADPEEATPAEEIPPEVDEIVAGQGRASARLAFLGDKAFLFSTAHDAFIMFGVEGRSWVSMGDPVGDPEAFPDLVWDFRSRALRHGGWPVFYQATPDHLPLYIDLGLALIKLGEEGIIDLPPFSMEGSRRSGLRQTLRRTERAGGTFDVVAPEEVPSHLMRLREISDAWLEAKSAREKSFSLGSFSDDYLRRFPAALLRVEGRPVAFANLLVGAPGSECAPDLMRYDPSSSPDSAMEYLFIQSILWAKEEGFSRFSVGMAPLSGLAEGPLAPSWSRFGATLFRLGEHFYNFQGLRAYKEKFDPEWEPRYLAGPGGFALPRVLTHVSSLVGGGLRGVLAR